MGEQLVNIPLGEFAYDENLCAQIIERALGLAEAQWRTPGEFLEHLHALLGAADALRRHRK